MSAAIRRITMTFSGCAASCAASCGAAPSAYGWNNAARWASGSRDRSAMSSPANVTESDSRRRRFPWHSGHSLLRMKWSARFFISGLFEFAKLWSTCRFAPVNVPM